MISRLRIGYYMAPYPEGGIARHALALIDHIRHAHSIVVFCEPRGKEFTEALSARGVVTRAVPAYATEKKGILRPLLKSWSPLLQARAALAAERLDIIHFHAGRIGAIYPAILASRMAGIPTRLLTVHNPMLRRSPLQRLFEGGVLGSLDRIIAVCEEVKGELASKKNAPAEKIAVIVNGVDTSEFDASEDGNVIRRELAIDGTAAVVGVIGRLQYYKGVDLFIRAVAQLKPRWPELRAALIGSGPEEGVLRALAEAEGVADIVHFAGYRSDARRLMRALDVIAIPSRYEAQPFALLEAMAAGKPVVAASVGGIPGALIDGVTGLLFPSESVAALAEALEKLLNDPQKRAAMGQAARARVEKEFSQAAMLEKTLGVYDRLTREKRKQSF